MMNISNKTVRLKNKSKSVTNLVWSTHLEIPNREKGGIERKGNFINYNFSFYRGTYGSTLLDGGTSHMYIIWCLAAYAARGSFKTTLIDLVFRLFIVTEYISQ